MFEETNEGFRSSGSTASLPGVRYLPGSQDCCGPFQSAGDNGVVGPDPSLFTVQDAGVHEDFQVVGNGGLTQSDGSG